MKSTYKSIVDILYDGWEKWWTIEEITAKALNMEYDIFMDKHINILRSREMNCYHIKTFIPCVREYLFTKMETILMTNTINGRTCYKVAIRGDEDYLKKYLKNRKRLNKRAIERFNKMLDNVKQNKLLPEQSNII